MKLDKFLGQVIYCVSPRELVLAKLVSACLWRIRAGSGIPSTPPPLP